MKVILKYSMIFDPAETWSKISDFEADFAKFFTDRGCEIEVIQTPTGSTEEKILLINRKQTLVEDKKEPTPRQVKRQLTAKRDVEGKYE